MQVIKNAAITEIAIRVKDAKAKALSPIFDAFDVMNISWNAA